jgi:predicted RNase H-like HicB family nuclease
MNTYEIDLELADPHGFAVTVPALPGLLILGTSLDEVLTRARASITWHARAHEHGQLPEDIARRPRSRPAVIVASTLTVESDPAATQQ